MINGVYVKDLNRLGRNLKDTIIVDVIFIKELITNKYKKNSENSFKLHK